MYSVLPYESDAARLEHMEQMAGTGRRGSTTGGSGGHEGGGERPLVGRDEEMQAVLGRAAGLVSGSGIGGAIVIEGNTGDGLVRCHHLCRSIIATASHPAVWPML